VHAIILKCLFVIKNSNHFLTREDKEKQMLFDEDVKTTGNAGDDTASEPEKPEGEEVPQDGEEQNV
jgi:hypothetical protein